MLIGLCGSAGVGKDTVGDILQRTYHFNRYSMAGPLKRGLAAMGFPEPSDRLLKEELVDGFEFSWRKAAQTLGTEWGRNLQDDIWVRLAEIEVQKGYDLVITDIRFENEAEMVNRNGGYVVLVSGRDSTVKGAQAAHASEQGLQRHDYILDNSGSVYDLMENVHVMLRHFGAQS